MTIATYADLQTAIVDWYKDRSDLSGFAPDIIALAEAYFNSTLRLREMETIEDLTPDSDGVCAIPTECIELKRVVELASIRRPLEYITEDAADDYYPSRQDGLANHYMIVGSDLIALPISANDIEITYYRNIPPLILNPTGNWLLTKSPNLYLHTCLMYAAEMQHESDEFAKEVALVTRFVELLTAADNRGKFGNAGMTLRGPIW